MGRGLGCVCDYGQAFCCLVFWFFFPSKIFLVFVPFIVRSHCVTLVDLKLMVILLLQPPKFGDYKQVPLWSDPEVFLILSSKGG